MKVYELISELSKVRAGMEVRVSLSGTMDADINEAYDDGEHFIINGDDAALIDSNGDSMGLLSEIANVDDDDDQEEQ